MPLNVDPSADVNTGFPGIDRVARALIDAIIGIRNWLNARNGPDLYALRLNPDQGKDGPITPVDGMIAFWNGRSIWAPKDSAGVTMTNAGPYYYLNKGWNTFGPPEGRYVPIDPDTGVGYMGNDKAFGAEDSDGDVEAAWYPRTATDNMIFQTGGDPGTGAGTGTGNVLYFRDSQGIIRAQLYLRDERGLLGLSGPLSASTPDAAGIRLALSLDETTWGVGLTESAQVPLGWNMTPHVQKSNGDIIVLESGTSFGGWCVRRYMANGYVYNLSGSYSATGYTNSTAAASRYGSTYSNTMALSHDETYVYIRDNNRLRRVNLSTGASTELVATLAYADYLGHVSQGIFVHPTTGDIYYAMISGGSSLLIKKVAYGTWAESTYATISGLGFTMNHCHCMKLLSDGRIALLIGDLLGGVGRIYLYDSTGPSTTLLCGGQGIGGGSIWPEGAGSAAGLGMGDCFEEYGGYLYFCSYHSAGGALRRVALTTGTTELVMNAVTANKYFRTNGLTRYGDWLYSTIRDNAFGTVHNVSMARMPLPHVVGGSLPFSGATYLQYRYPNTFTTGSNNFSTTGANGGGPDDVWHSSAGDFHFYQVDRVTGAATRRFTVYSGLTLNDSADGKVYLAALKTLHTYSTLTPGAGAYTMDLVNLALYPHPVVKISPSAAGNLNVISNGTSGQTITIVAGNGNLTITNGAALLLSGGVDFVMASGDDITLVNEAGNWRETARNQANIGYGTSTPGAGNFTLVMASFGIISHPVIKISPSAAAAMNNITGGFDGQSVSVVAGNANLTINYVGGTIETRGAANYAMAANEVCTLVRAGGVWYESARTP